jgi:MerR family mercuric resistance operon transcriptional regulator
MVMKAPPLTIGRLAAAAGVGVETIRFYQKRGLIDTPQAISGYRHYSPSHVERIRFIRKAQSLGFSLEEISDLLRLDEEWDRDVARRLAREKIGSIEARIAQLQHIANALGHLLSACEHNDNMPCPIIRMSLDSDSPEARSRL